MRTQAVLVYDGDCAFCTTSVRFVERRVRPRCEITPWQFADLEALGTTRQRAEYELLWITPAGHVRGGAEAVAALLRAGGGGWPVMGTLLTLPPVLWAARGVYRLVANHRDRLPGGTPVCALPADRRPPSAPRT